ncbi:MAG: glycosyltransferase family 2 protein [Chloroflexi bacterium]|nr:glycosyltransferase family 2 protein [Chloroflexota bacterium]
MPRIGMNPSRGQSTDYKPAKVTLVMLTYIPNDIGYFEKRFEVLRTSLESYIQNTTIPYDLIVFDNNSNANVVNYLKDMRDRGKIDYLILSSRNIGKMGALQIAFRAAPGEIIAYTDDDVFFLPGWLERHLEVLETYPRVGMVTGLYIRPHMKEGIGSVMRFIEEGNADVRRGDLVSKDLQLHYIENTGRTWEQYQKETEGLEDMVLTYKGVTALASSGHYQFVTRKEVILQALPGVWQSQLMGKMRELDLQVDLMGYLRLCTHPATIRLLGNVIDPEMAKQISAYGFSITPSEVKVQERTLRARIMRLPFVQRVAYFLYNRLFKIINA